MITRWDIDESINEREAIVEVVETQGGYDEVLSPV